MSVPVDGNVRQQFRIIVQEENPVRCPSCDSSGGTEGYASESRSGCSVSPETSRSLRYDDA
jgi:hypothetical protein